MRGRKPKPTWQKKLEGNRGKRALNADEPQFAPVEEQPPPEVLRDRPVALAEWQRLLPILRSARAITEGDLSALIALCLEWDRYLEAIRVVRERGMVLRLANGLPMINPYVTIGRAALNHCQKMWAEMGLTPSSRSRVRTEPTGPMDEFTEFDAAPRAAH